MTNLKVGYQTNVTDKNCPVKSVSLYDALRLMEIDEKLKQATECIRKAKTKDDRDKLKKGLPAIIVSADTTCRKVSDEDTRNPLIYIDIDLSDNPGVNLEKVVDSMDYGWLIGHQESPSGGVKALCGIEANVETHKQSFEALEAAFAQHGLVADKACKDLKRVTFLCHSPDIRRTLIEPLLEWKGETIKPLAKENAPPSMFDVEGYNDHPAPSPHSSNLSADEEAEECLAYISPDVPYDEWVSVGMALNAHGASSSVFENWSSGGTKYKQGEPAKKWASFNGDGVNFGTLVEMAKRNNGGLSPLARQRDTVNVSKDFDNLTEEQKAAQDSKFPSPMCGGMMQIDYCHDPEEVVKGVVARGEKMQIAGSSKAGKTWALLHLAGAIQTGGEFMGMECVQGDVLFLNFELSPVRMRQRIDAIPTLCAVTFLNFRGIQCDWQMIKRGLEKLGGNYSTIIFDPIYKMLGKADENSNGDIANLLHHVEQVASERNAMAVYSHHFSKGNKAGVDQIDRQSGAGTWGRDPDALISLTPHSEDGCLVMEHTLRSYAKPESSVWKFEFPNYVHQPDENPASLKKAHGGGNKLGSWQDAEHAVKCHPEGIVKASLVKEIMSASKCSDSSARRYIDDAVGKDKIHELGGIYTTRQQDPQQDALAEEKYKKAI